MPDRFDFDRVARVPAPGDNVAIATRRLAAGTLVADGAGEFRLSHTILEGHRFVRAPIPRGSAPHVVGTPVRHRDPCPRPRGVRLQRRDPGRARANATSTSSFRRLRTSATPSRPTSSMKHRSRRASRSRAPIPRATFDGFRRPGGRGVGTRNFVVVLATTSRANGFARQVADRAAGKAPAANRWRGRGDPHRRRRHRPPEQSRPRAAGARGVHGAPQRWARCSRPTTGQARTPTTT